MSAYFKRVVPWNPGILPKKNGGHWWFPHAELGIWKCQAEKCQVAIAAPYRHLHASMSGEALCQLVTGDGRTMTVGSWPERVAMWKSMTRIADAVWIRIAHMLKPDVRHLIRVVGWFSQGMPNMHSKVCIFITWDGSNPDNYCQHLVGSYFHQRLW